MVEVRNSLAKSLGVEGPVEVVARCEGICTLVPYERPKSDQQEAQEVDQTLAPGPVWIEAERVLKFHIPQSSSEHPLSDVNMQVLSPLFYP